MKLLAVHHGGGVGGAPVSLLKLLAALDQTKFQPRAVFTEPGPITNYADEMRVPASVVPTGGAFFYSAHARLAPRTLARFLRTFPSAVRTAQVALRAERPDLLHLNTSVLLAWAAAARRENVPVVWMAREVLGPNSLLRGWHARYMLSHARRVVAISEAVRACFPAGARVELVYNAVDLDEFRLELLDDRESTRASLGIAPTDRVIMAIGSVQPVKGQWLLLDAFERLQSRSPTARLALVCGGVDAAYRRGVKGRVKALLRQPMDHLDALLHDAEARGVRDRVLVTGFRRDIARVLTAADVLAFPSLEPEGFGRPLIEAMAVQRPVVATDVGPSRELIGPEAGVTVQPAARQLADALTEVLSSHELSSRMGRAGRARVEQRFSLPQQVAAMEHIYADALAQGESQSTRLQDPRSS